MTDLHTPEYFDSASQAAAVRVIPKRIIPARFGTGSGTLAVLTPVGFDVVNDVWGVWTAKTQEVNTITSGGTPPTSGYFTLTVNGEKTAPLAYNSTAAQIQAALELLNGVGVGNVACVATAELNLGVAAAVVTITWSGKLASRDIVIALDWVGQLAPTIPTVNALEAADGDWGAAQMDFSIDDTEVASVTLGDTTAVATIPTVLASETADGDWASKDFLFYLDGILVATVTSAADDDSDAEIADVFNADAAFAAAGLFADVTAAPLVRVKALGHPGAHTLLVYCSTETTFGASPGTSNTGTEATTDDDSNAEVVAALNADADFRAAGLFASISGGVVRVEALGHPGEHKLSVYSDTETAYGASPGTEDTGTDAPAAHTLATSAAGVSSGGRHEIRGFIFPDAVTLNATEDILGNVVVEGKIRYADIPTPSGESSANLLKALRDGPMARGLQIMGLSGIR